MATRISDASGWIATVCRDFSQATGWPLQYTPAAAVEAAKLESRLQSDPECCWWAAVENGQGRAGFLHIDLPDDPERDHSFLAVCELGRIVADLLSRVLSTARQLESRTRDVTTLVDIGLSVPREQDLIDALNRLLRAALQLTGFRAAGFFLLDAAAEELNLRAFQQLDPLPLPFPQRDLADDPPDAEALAECRVLLHHGDESNQNPWMPSGASTALCVAVHSESGPIGTLWAFDRRKRVPTGRESHVLESIAAQIAAVLERVVLLRENADGERLRSDLRVASQSQTADVLRELPPGAGFDAAAICTSRYELGGDLCELIPVDTRRTVVAIGDASGDGVPAAMVMAAVRGALRALSDSPPGEALRTERVVDRLNKTLHSITPSHQFMSLLYGVLDPAAGSFTYTNAGHPMPLLVHRGEIKTLQSHGLLLGILPDAEYERSTLALSPGDILVFFSDGVSEAMNVRQKMFRQDGIVDVVRRHLDGTAHDLMQAIWDRLETHTAGGRGDDRTLLVVRMPSIR